MTGAVALVTALAAAVLAFALLWIVIKQGRVVRDLSAEIAGLRTELTAQDERVAQLADANEAALNAIELMLADHHRTEAETEVEDVAVITDISDRFGTVSDDDLTRARIASVTLGGPLIKVAAFSHGVRRALDEEQRMRISYAVRKELRRQRKMRRRRRTHEAPSKRWAG